MATRGRVAQPNRRMLRVTPSDCRSAIDRNRGPASPQSAPVTKILSWPCMFEKTWYFFLNLDTPVLMPVERFRPCRFQFRM